MKQLALLLLFLPLLLGDRLAAEDWIGLDETSALELGADLAVEDTGEYRAGVTFDQELGTGAGINGDYRFFELSGDEEEFESLALATALWIELSELVDVEVSYFFEGNIDELEKETLGLALGFNRGDWNFQVQVEDGEMRLFTRSDLSNQLSRIIPDRIDSDVVGYGFLLGWQHEGWYWQASYQRFDYDRDLSVLDRSDFARFIVKPSALAQSSLLISRYSALVIGYAAPLDDYSLMLAQDQSAIDNVYNDILVVNWQHWISRNLGYLLAVSFPESEEAGLSLGLRWVM